MAVNYLSRDPRERKPSACTGRDLFDDGTWRTLAANLQLTPRELDIIKGMFDGKIETVIAAELGISRGTAHTHLERIFRKLGVHDRVSLAVCVFATFLRLHAGPEQAFAVG